MITELLYNYFNSSSNVQSSLCNGRGIYVEFQGAFSAAKNQGIRCTPEPRFRKVFREGLLDLEA